MNKIKKTMTGIVVGACVIGSSIVSCLAATGEIKAEITANRAYGRFICSETGHQLTVEVYYSEVGPDGKTTIDSISNSQFGNITTVVASRNSPDGYRYTRGRAAGLIDKKTVALSPEAIVE